MNRLQSIPLFSLALFAASVPSAQAALRVVTTTTDLAALAREVGGDRVDVTALAAGNQDPHFVDAKPSYLVKLQRADLFVQVGMDLELGWAPTLLTNARNPRIQPGGPGFVDASAGIARLQVPAATDRSAGDIHAYGNPHYWLDPENGRIVARTLEAALERVDPSGAAAYRARLADFERRLDAALERWRRLAEPLRGVPVVAYHNAFPYLEQRFGFRILGFVEPKPGIPPSGRYVAELAQRMRQEEVKVVLSAPFYDAKTSRLVASESGATIAVLATSVEGLPEATDYLSLFDVDLARILAALAPRGY
jgi:zinc/manganese transport system substrate-binding protein